MAMWPYIEMTRLSTDAAITLLSLLALVLFAWLVEVGRNVQSLREAGQDRSSLGRLFRSLLFVLAGHALSVAPLLGAINSGGLCGGSAMLVWIVALTAIAIDAVAILAWTVFR